MERKETSNAEIKHQPLVLSIVELVITVIKVREEELASIKVASA